MPRETPKNTGARRRTTAAKQRAENPRFAWRSLLEHRAIGPAILTAAVFFAIIAIAIDHGRNAVLAAPDRLPIRTITARVPFEVVDDAATRRARDLARQRADRAYIADENLFEELRASLINLPASLGAVTTPDAVESSIRELFGISTAEDLTLINANLDENNEIKPAWRDSVNRLFAQLEQRPVLSTDEYQLQLQSAGAFMVLSRLVGVERQPDRIARVRRDAALDASSDRLADTLRLLARDTGFPPRIRDIIITRLTAQPLITFRLDHAASEILADTAARAVQPTLVSYREGDVLVRRAEPVQPQAIELLRAERQQFIRTGTIAQRSLRFLGPATAAAAITAGIAACIAIFFPQIARNPTRFAAVAALMALALVTAIFTASAQPAFIALAITAPSVFVAVILVIAYDQRTSLTLAGFHAAAVAVALFQPVGIYAISLMGIVAAVASLKELRERNTLVKTGAVLFAVLSAATFGATFLYLPPTAAAAAQALADALYAGAGGILVAMIAVFILPLIERAFGITTGMTLIELRDPRKELLRLLQQRAPGSYNHSLNVASLGEAAADAIGADSLLTYVGALYHDIGKLNKPEYFVENQTPGFNRHSKLNPALSVLIIVGHVKDGIELAKEYNLPKPLHHFIEAHHGTTLVEYFYHRAIQSAEDKKGDGQPELPTEFDYRYPGPKPKTKEVAIIMLCDAVESAARAMADPSPSRVEQTVRAIANKRLMDGQFDECNLTLKELNTIVRTVSNTLASIYHGRIAYPTADKPKPETKQHTTPANQTNQAPAAQQNPARADSPGIGAP